MLALKRSNGSESPTRTAISLKLGVVYRHPDFDTCKFQYLKNTWLFTRETAPLTLQSIDSGASMALGFSNRVELGLNLFISAPGQTGQTYIAEGNLAPSRCLYSLGDWK